MKTYSLLAQKGGAGKTTVAVHLAVLAVQEGARTLLVDIDPQGSAAGWWHSRDAEAPELVTCQAQELENVLEAARRDGVDVVFVDTAPHAEAAATTAARLSDLVLIPCRPGVLDLRAIGASVDIVNAIGAHAAVVLNACPPGRGFGEAGLTREAREALGAYETTVCPVSITQRAAYGHALIDGRAVTEFEHEGGKAAQEVRKLWEWLHGKAR